jgi:hypothetical protein
MVAVVDRLLNATDSIRGSVVLAQLPHAGDTFRTDDVESWRSWTGCRVESPDQVLDVLYATTGATMNILSSGPRVQPSVRRRRRHHRHHHRRDVSQSC